MYESESDADLEERTRIERQEIVARYDLGRDEGAKIDDWEDPKLEVYHKQDRWGFIHDERLPDSKSRSERERKQIQVEVSRAQKWAEMINSENVKKYFGTKAKYREKMINRVHKGVPDSVRGRFWYILLDLDNIKRQQAGKYHEMRNLARSHSSHIRQIDLDVNRTYREHVMFRERYNGRQQALFHVLAAYSVYNSEVGYCQGMSQIAALLLMYLIDEEDAFWALSQLMVDSKYAMHGMFIIGFPKLLRLQTHHEKVLKKFLPRLKKHLDKNGIDTGLYTLKWFFQCFLDRVPFSIAIRVWDLFLLEGERVLSAMAYNILRMHRRYIMRLGMDELIEHLQINLGKDFGYEDDVVVEKLRDVMHELRSSRLDYAGRPPAEELPQVPFGLVPTTLIPPTKDSLGVRLPLSEKEREISTTRIMQIQANEEAVINSNSTQQNSGYLSKQISLADGDRSLGEDDTGSSEIISRLHSTSPPTSAAPGGTNDDVDTSFDVSSDIILPNDSEDTFLKGFKGDRNSSGSRGLPSNVSFYPDGTSSPQHKRRSGTSSHKFRNQSSTGSASGDGNRMNHSEKLSRSPLPPSEAQDRLDDSVRLLLEAADGLNGRKGETIHEDAHRISILNTSANSVKSNRGNSNFAGLADTSFGSGGGSSLRDEDIVRIRVPYNREDAEKMAALASADKTLLQSSQKQKPVSNNASAKSGNSDRNKIVLTVNHKESESIRRTEGANGSQQIKKSNKMSGNSSYITQSTKSNGSPEKLNLSSPSLVLSRSADQVDQNNPNRMQSNDSDHPDMTGSLTRNKRQNPPRTNNDYHHPHYTHHRAYTSKLSENAVTSTEKQSSNSQYKYGYPYRHDSQIDDQVEQLERKYVSTTMQNVIKSTSSRENASNLPSNNAPMNLQSEARSTMQYSSTKEPSLISSEMKPNTSSSRSHRYNKVSEESYKTSSDVVKRTKNMISSPERNSKPPTHETYHIEEML